jgi:hypothetical protein
MHIINALLNLSMVIGGGMVIWSIYDLYVRLGMRRALVRSLANDPEFVQKSPHVWETDWEAQYIDEDFKTLRKLIQQHIERLGFRRSGILTIPLNQAHLINRLRYIRGLTYEVEKCVRQQV